MSGHWDVIIVGGGLAGLCSALHLCKLNKKVLLIEKNKYPFHKVCGEYISNEIIPYLEWLGVTVDDLNAEQIHNLSLSTERGYRVETKLPLGGFGISRYQLDFYLYNKAIQQGCMVLEDQVLDIEFVNGVHQLTTQKNGNFESNIVLGAYGKRASLDKKLSRDFIEKKTGWLAVKAHYQGAVAPGTVSLHHFQGGYCGVSRVENGIINICYLSDFNTFKKYKDINEHQEQILYKNKALRQVFETSKPIFDKPISISQIFFDKKETVHNHIIMIGDTAGLIHPFCGNGMAMAMHSASIASHLVTQYLDQKLSRKELERKYKKEWRIFFNSRLNMGKIVAKLLSNSLTSRMLLRIVTASPKVLRFIIKQTHGKPLSIANL